MPVMKIFRTAYGFVLGRMGQFFGIGLPAILGMTFIYSLEDYDYSQTVLAIIAQVLLDAYFGLLWHRYFLLGRDYAGISGLPSGATERQRKAFGRISLLFGWMSVRLVLVLILAAMFVVTVAATIAFNVIDFPLDIESSTDDEVLIEISTIIAYATPLGLYAVLGAFVVRILPIFPAVASGNTTTGIRAIWKMTREHWLRIWLCFMLVMALQAPLSMLLEYVAGLIYGWQALPGLVASVASSALIATAYLFMLAVGVTANSEIYRRLTGFDAAAMR